MGIFEVAPLSREPLARLAGGPSAASAVRLRLRPPPAHGLPKTQGLRRSTAALLGLAATLPAISRRRPRVSARERLLEEAVCFSGRSSPSSSSCSRPSRNRGSCCVRAAGPEDEADEDSPAVGIDFGTTNSCVAVRRADGQFVLLPPIGMPPGRTTMPSVVAYNSRGQSLVGAAALKIKIDGINQVLFRSVKRLLGRTYAEAHAAGIQPNRFGAEPTGHAREMVRMRLPGGRAISPEEVAAAMIKVLILTAENYLGKPVKKAVMGMPAGWTKYQRRALEHAAELAGLETVRLIPEPELAVRAYGLRVSPTGSLTLGTVGSGPGGSSGGEHEAEDEDEEEEMAEDEQDEDWPEDPESLDPEERTTEPTMRHILVADLGGGTFDVCIVRQWVEWDEIHMLFTAGDERLGGDDFDDAIVDWTLRNLRTYLEDRKQWPISADARTQLKQLARKAKERLSSSESADLDFAGGKVTITRDSFNSIAVEVIKRLLRPIQDAAYGAKVRLPFETLAFVTMEEASRKNKPGARPKKRQQTEKDMVTASKALTAKHKTADTQVADEIMIDEVLCVGAATLTPAVRELLQLVTGCEPNSKFVDPEAAVALGAAILASIMDSKTRDLQVHSSWRLAWTEYVLKRPDLMQRLKTERSPVEEEMVSDAAP